MTFEEAMTIVWDRSGYDRGFISNPFAGDDAARLGLVRTREVLDRLGNPERNYPIVHVAGSKGKGSTCSFVDSVLRQAGARCGRFLSPHIHAFQERFVVDDEQIDEDHFAEVVGKTFSAILDVETTLPEIGPVTAWELSTAMALLWFLEASCDVVVLEVGMGGTLDATNVIEPAVSVITRLDFEHTAILGTTMPEIAANKAGIIKPGKPVVSAAQPDAGMAVIAARAREMGSTLLTANQDWTVSGTDEYFSIRSPNWEHTKLHSSLPGQHQVDNAGLAVAALHVLDQSGRSPVAVTDQAIRAGLASTFLPGRFEVIEHATGATIVIDGAHSPESTKALAATLASRFPNITPTLIVGMLSDKEPGLVLAPLVPLTSRWIVSRLNSPRSIDPAAMVSSLQQRGIGAQIAPSIAKAIERALEGNNVIAGQTLIVITGSLTTVSEARVELGLAN